MNKKPQHSLNPAELGLTDAQHEVFKIVSGRQAKGKTITSGDVASAWGGKNRSYAYKVLRSLMDKGLVEQYSQKYYRLVNTETEKGN